MDKTLIKGLLVIEALAASEEPRGITSLSQELKLSKSNVHRIIVTLQSRNYVRRVHVNTTYELTSRIWELGTSVRSRLNFIKISHSYMMELAKATGESVHLSILDGVEVVYVDKIESTQPIGSYTRIGGRAPAWCVATGKVMLAQQPEDSLREIQFKQFTSKTVMDIETLRQHLTLARSRGYAVNRGEWREDVFGVAGSLLDGTGHLVGAIGISGPSKRFTAKKIEGFAQAVVSAATAISRTLGHSRA